MIAGERTTAYINSLDMGNTELLNQIEKEALETYVPIIRRETQSFLKTLLAAQKNPENYKGLIVRVAGYSAYFGELKKAVQDDVISRTIHTA